MCNCCWRALLCGGNVILEPTGRNTPGAVIAAVGDVVMHQRSEVAVKGWRSTWSYCEPWNPHRDTSDLADGCFALVVEPACLLACRSPTVESTTEH